MQLFLSLTILFVLAAPLFSLTHGCSLTGSWRNVQKVGDRDEVSTFSFDEDKPSTLSVTIKSNITGGQLCVIKVMSGFSAIYSDRTQATVKIAAKATSCLTRGNCQQKSNYCHTAAANQASQFKVNFFSNCRRFQINSGGTLLNFDFTSAAVNSFAFDIRRILLFAILAALLPLIII